VVGEAAVAVWEGEEEAAGEREAAAGEREAAAEAGEEAEAVKVEVEAAAAEDFPRPKGSCRSQRHR
jgi:hypothetical protein